MLLTPTMHVFPSFPIIFCIFWLSRQQAEFTRNFVTYIVCPTIYLVIWVLINTIGIITLVPFKWIHNHQHSLKCVISRVNNFNGIVFPTPLPHFPFRSLHTFDQLRSWSVGDRRTSLRNLAWYPEFFINCIHSDKIGFFIRQLSSFLVLNILLITSYVQVVRFCCQGWADSAIKGLCGAIGFL